MIHEWLPLHLLGPLAAFLAWGLAWMVYMARPRAAANRRLAILLAVEGFAAMALGGANSLEAMFGFNLVGGQRLINFVLVMIPGTYLLFLATLDGSAAVLLRGRSGAAILVLAVVVVPVTWFVAGGLSFAGPPGQWHVLMLWLIFGGAYGLVASLTALARARTAQQRFRMRAYALAFGLHDVFWIVGALITGRLVDTPYALQRVFAWGTPQLTLLFFAPLLAYGMLRYQLLGIELKVKWTLRRSTLLTMLAAAFFVAKEGTEALLPTEGFLPSVAGAAIVAAIALPTWRLAGGLADRLLPGVEASPGYLDERRALVYRTQLEGMVVDGKVTQKERQLLHRLRESLALERDAAALLEEEILGTRGVKS